MSIRALLTAAVMCCAVLLPAQPASALERHGADHCVLHVTGQRTNGEYLTTEVCHRDFADAMASVGVHTNAVHPLELDVTALEDETIIATHFDYWGLTGGSVTVAGTTCTGGWLNLPTNWRNRVSSTLSTVCSTIAHFDDLNLGGASETTSPSGNLSTLNNRAESVQYL